MAVASKKIPAPDLVKVKRALLSVSDKTGVVELARNDEERAILAAVMNATEVGTAFMTTPGAPRKASARSVAGLISPVPALPVPAASAMCADWMVTGLVP